MGGQELRVLVEAAGMVRRGHTVVLAVQPGSWLEGEGVRRRLPVEPVLQRQSRYPPLILEFLRLIKKHRIQIVNTHGSVDGWAATIAAKLSPMKPLIVRSRHKSTPVKNTFHRRILYGRLSDVVMTTGEAVRQDLVNRLTVDTNHVVSIPTGVDLRVFTPRGVTGGVRAEFGFAPTDFVIGTVSFLRSYKGLPVLIDAARLVCSRHPEARFLIVGDGEDRETIAGQIERLGLKNRVVLAGHREDVPTLLAHMDLYVQSSIKHEGLPQGLTQAMAMERPVVATAVGSIGEVVRNRETGLLVAPGDPGRLAEGLCELIRDCDLRGQMAKAGRRLIEASYSFEGMLDRVERLYERLVDERNLGGVSQLSQ
jgi:glycosyltransferase involved in cell wall biosynthesis